MDKLQALCLANPQIPIYSVRDPEFRRYGRVIEEDTVPSAQQRKARRFRKKAVAMQPLFRNWTICRKLRPCGTNTAVNWTNR